MRFIIVFNLMIANAMVTIVGGSYLAQTNPVLAILVGILGMNMMVILFHLSLGK